MSRVRRVAALAAFALSLTPAAAPADVFKPTLFDDPPPGKCKPHDCSLREAVIATNHLPGADTIRLAAGQYILTIPDTGTSFEQIDPKSGDLNLRGPVTIRGQGVRKTAVEGTFLDRVFFLFFEGDGTQTLRGMTIAGGQSGSEPGGGVLVAVGKARLDRVVVSHNAATTVADSGSGGGIYSLSSHLVIDRSTIADNVAGGQGGGVFFDAGIVQPGAEIRASTISGNRASLGGGIALDGTNDGFATKEPELNVVNSTFAKNQASVSGGGISAIQGAGLALDNSTIAHNHADSDNQNSGEGGGLYQSTSASFLLDDSILAGNEVGSSGLHPQCSGTFPGDGNVIEPQIDGCTANYLFVADTMLGPLARNGGPTETFALLKGSPAIRRAFACPKRDQSGRKRPPDCDAGAYERTPSDP